VQRLAAALCLPAGGHLQPSLDVPVRPWVDHHGRLNTQLWSSLVKKALAAAARQPGACSCTVLRPGCGAGRCLRACGVGVWPCWIDLCCLRSCGGCYDRLLHHMSAASVCVHLDRLQACPRMLS
jgi:hypothetical protein